MERACGSVNWIRTYLIRMQYLAERFSQRWRTASLSNDRVIDEVIDEVNTLVARQIGVELELQSK